MSGFTHALAVELRQAAAEAPDRPFIRMLAGEWTYGADRPPDRSRWPRACTRKACARATT